MMGKISLLFLMSSSLCLSQATTAAPGSSTQSSQSSSSPLTGSGSLQALPSNPGQREADPADQATPTLKVERESKSKSKSESRTVKSEKTGDQEDLEESEKDNEEETSPETRKTRRITVRSDFEIFAEQAAGHRLDVFGRSLFDKGPTTFAPLSNIPVPADYVIGPGDQLVIRAWGKIDVDATVTVDRRGQVILPKIGPVNVAGLRYEQLDECVRKAIETIYKGFDLNVQMGQLRTIQIYVLGNARQPGEFTVSSLSNLLDALFSSGGPSATGTMRHIQLQRAGKVITEIDIYDLIRKGDKSHDVHLLPGDVIFIPVIGPQIAVIGSVKEPGIYEMMGDTTVAKAIEEASGLTALATTSGVLLERVENRKLRHVDEFALDATGMQRQLKDADMLKISPISPKFENAVMIRGNVASPGRFPWHEGMRVSDLIPTRDSLIVSEHWSMENARGVSGHANLLEDVAATSAEINWSYASIERMDEHDFSTRLIPFNLGNAVDDPTSSDNQVLKIGDIVTVFSRKDLALPRKQHQIFVTIGGEVNVAGVYRIQDGETLRTLVARAGGFTGQAYLFGAQLSRASIRQIEEEEMKLSIQKLERELTDREVKQGEDSLRLERQNVLIDRISEIHAVGRVVLGIKPLAKTIEDIPDIQLEDGDSFQVPANPTTVQVLGEVYNPAAFEYVPNRHLTSYLSDAGGATREADLSHAFLIHANGTVVSKQNRAHHVGGKFGNLSLLPGDALVLPPNLKVKGRGFADQLPVIAQILSGSSMTALLAYTATR